MKEACQQPQRKEMQQRGRCWSKLTPSSHGSWGRNVTAHSFTPLEGDKCSRVYTPTQIYVHTCTHTQRNTYRHTQSHTRTPTYPPCTYAHTQVNTYIHTYVHIHVPMRTPPHICAHVHTHLFCLLADTCYKAFLANIRFKLSRSHKSVFLPKQAYLNLTLAYQA